MIVEELAWDDFLDAFHWEQGDHLTLIGPTKSGKTTLLQRILAARLYTVVFGCKAKDPTLERFAKDEGYRVIRDWPPPNAIIRGQPARYILWPKAKSSYELKAKQHDVFGRALEDIYQGGGYCAAIDELHYMEAKLGLTDAIESLYEQGRTNNITVAAGTQRPRHVTLDAFTQVSHFFLWKTGDLGDRKRLGEISGHVDTRAVADELARLGRHQALYLDAPHGRLVRTEVQL